MMKRQRIFRKRPGFSLIEALMVASLLSICAAGVTRTWYLCYTLNNQAQQMQAGKDIVEQEMERVRRLNWTGLAEQTSYTARYYYDSGGNPSSATTSVANGYVSYIKVETLNSNGLSVATTPTVDASGGNSRSLRRVTIVVQPTGTSATASTYTAKAVTYMTLGGP
jgi:prepilin-type N-terminal cleavage/methylation domain-containing protein